MLGFMVFNYQLTPFFKREKKAVLASVNLDICYIAKQTSVEEVQGDPIIKVVLL